MPPELETAIDTGTETQETGFDFEAAADTIGKDLGFSHQDQEPGDQEATLDVATEATTEPAALTAKADVPVARQAPKTWPKEMHAHWEKTPKEVQDYWDTREKQMLDGITSYKEAATFGKTIHDAVAPYQEDFAFNKVDAPTGIKFLLEANRKLTTGPMEARQAAYAELGQRLGFNGTAQGESAQSIDPHIHRLQQELASIKSGLTAQQQASYQDAKAKTAQEVEAFAADPTHGYFDECADHIVRLIQAGYSLQESYETAVMANPVTKAKEIARIQTDYEAKLRENARLAALPKKKAASVNVRGADTRRGPTDPLGSMEDTIRETLASQKNRV